MPKLINQLLSFPQSLGYVSAPLQGSANRSLDLLTCLSLALFPLLYMTLRGWTNYFVFILLLLAIIHFVTKPRTPPTHKNQAQEQQHRLATWAIIFTLASPILAIFFSQLFRGEFTSSAFDGPSRFLLAVPVFLYLKDRSFNFTKIIEWTIPISLMICLGAYLLNPAASEEWGGRAATYFVDTITFGVYCLILGFICLASIRSNDSKEFTTLTILKLIGFTIGCYLAIQSQSRSAWTAGLSLIIAISFIQLHRKHPLAPWGMILLGLISMTAIYFTSTGTQMRIGQMILEISEYFNGSNLDTSTGIRISMMRVAVHLMMEYPLTGLKDGIMPPLNSIASIQPYYSELLEYVTTEAGVHTEILAQGVRSGIFGLISSTALFLVPGFVFWKRLSHPNQQIRSAAIIGFVLVLGLFIAALTIQVYNLKYTSSFYALMIAALSAQALQHQSTANQ
jgi:O-antigen ligase